MRHCSEGTCERIQDGVSIGPGGGPIVEMKEAYIAETGQALLGPCFD